MNETKPITGRSARTTAAQRQEMIEAFEQSGMTKKSFAQSRGINYWTFCNWLKRARASRDKVASPKSRWMEVELSAPATPVGLRVRLGSLAWMELCQSGQVQLAAALIAEVEKRPC